MYKKNAARQIITREIYYLQLEEPLHLPMFSKAKLTYGYH